MIKFLPALALFTILLTSLVQDRIEFRQEMNAIEANVEETCNVTNYGPAF